MLLILVLRMIRQYFPMNLCQPYWNWEIRDFLFNVFIFLCDSEINIELFILWTTVSIIFQKADSKMPPLIFHLIGHIIQGKHCFIIILSIIYVRKRGSFFLLDLYFLSTPSSYSLPSGHKVDLGKKSLSDDI